MKPYSIEGYSKLSKGQKQKVVDIFVEGFAHLMTFTKDKEALKTLFSVGFDPNQIVVYLEGEEVCGAMGLATNKVRPVRFDLSCCTTLFGRMKGEMVSKQMNGIFQSQIVTQDTDLYIDFLATAGSKRGKGVATTLLKYAFSLEGYKDYYIEVFSRNKRAKRLYEKMGFIIYKKEYLSIMRCVGFGYPIKMKIVGGGEEKEIENEKKR